MTLKLYPVTLIGWNPPYHWAIASSPSEALSYLRRLPASNSIELGEAVETDGKTVDEVLSTLPSEQLVYYCCPQYELDEWWAELYSRHCEISVPLN